MKRTLEEGTCIDKPVVSSKKRRKIAEKASSKMPQWNEEEDAALSAAVVVWKKNWKIIAKEHNKLFKNSRKTSEECKGRFNEIRLCQDRLWDTNKDLLLIYALYSSNYTLTALPPVFPGCGPRQRILTFLLETAQRIKQKRFMCSRAMSPLSVLKTVVSLKLFLDSRIKESPIVESIKESMGITKEDCLALFSALVPRREISRPLWTVGSVKNYVDHVMEKIVNYFKGSEKEIDMGDIMHVRKEEPEVAALPQEQQVDYYWWPTYLYYGIPCLYYWITLYYSYSPVL